MKVDVQRLREDIAPRFASGNDVPVERAYITQAEWQGLLAIAEASEWRPIDSAPKDGTLVIIGAAGHESVSARWGWEAPWIDGWWCDGHRSDAEGPTFTPTHWRPLPKAPEGQSAGDVTP